MLGNGEDSHEMDVKFGIPARDSEDSCLEDIWMKFCRKCVSQVGGCNLSDKIGIVSMS